jgi:hypothetical protein
MSYNDEPQAVNIPIKEVVITILMTIALLIILIVLYNFIIDNFNKLENFRSACENYKGKFYILENTTCGFDAQDCIYRCQLKDKNYGLDEVKGDYNKLFCISDCAYQNKQAGGIVCVC